MALMTKGQIRTAVSQAIDDPTNKKWSQTNIDLLIQMVMDTMFETILDTYEYLTSQIDTQSTASDGSLALSALTKRFYRMQKFSLVSSGAELQPRLPFEQVPQSTYAIIGGKVQTVPIQNAISMNIQYSYLPTSFTALATDATQLPVEYPEGHESALVYVTAAWAMTKGDEESMAQIGRIADSALESLLTHIARLYPIGANARNAAIKNTLLRNPLVGGMAAANGNAQ
jgi:hypothetical protein